MSICTSQNFAIIRSRPPFIVIKSALPRFLSQYNQQEWASPYYFASKSSHPTLHIICVDVYFAKAKLLHTVISLCFTISSGFGPCQMYCWNFLFVSFSSVHCACSASFRFVLKFDEWTAQCVVEKVNTSILYNICEILSIRLSPVRKCVTYVFVMWLHSLHPIFCSTFGSSGDMVMVLSRWDDCRIIWQSILSLVTVCFTIYFRSLPKLLLLHFDFYFEKIWW